MNEATSTDFKPISLAEMIRNNITVFLTKYPEGRYTIDQIRTAPENRDALGHQSVDRLNSAAMDLCNRKVVVREHNENRVKTQDAKYVYRLARPGEKIDGVYRAAGVRPPATPTKPPVKKTPVKARGPAQLPPPASLDMTIPGSNGAVDSGDVKPYTLPELNIQVGKDGRSVLLDVAGIRLNISVKE